MRNFPSVRRRAIKKFFLHICTTEKHQLSLYVSVLIKVLTSIFSTSTHVPKLCYTYLISQCFFPLLLIRDVSYVLPMCAYILFFSITLFKSEKTAENTLFRFFAFWSRFSIFWPVFNHRFGPSKLSKGPEGPGLQRSSVHPPLCSSRACLHTAFIAFSVLCMFQWHCQIVRLSRSLSSLNQVRASPGLVLVEKANFEADFGHF